MHLTDTLCTLGTLCSAEAQGESSELHKREQQPEGGWEIACAMGGLKHVSCSQSYVNKPAVRANESVVHRILAWFRTGQVRPRDSYSFFIALHLSKSH